MPTRKYGAGTDADTTGTKAALLHMGNPDTNYEDWYDMSVDENGYEAILWLDIDAVIADIGSGHTITDVSLKIIPTAVDNSPTGYNVFIHQMLVFSGAASAHDWDNVSYNEKEMTENVQWGSDTQAAPLSGTDYAATELLSVGLADFTVSTEYSFNDSDLTDLVKDWYDGTTTDHGIFMRCDGEYNRLTFAGDTYSTSADRYYWEITYTESGGLTLTPSDTINMSDSITLNVKISKSDSITLSDSITKSLGLNKSDSISLSDNISNVVSFVRSLSDTINLSDELLKSLEIVLSDTINLSDNFSAIITLILSLNDSITMSDSILKTPNINKSDAINISDEIIKSFGLSETDTINLSDVISKSIATTRSDTINMTDNFNSLITLILALNDTINMSDDISKEIDLVKSDTINLSDNIIRSFGLTKSDIINLADNLSTDADVIYALLNFVAENKTFNFNAENKTFNFIAKPRGN